jgi:hypothetical protein
MKNLVTYQNEWESIYWEVDGFRLASDKKNPPPIKQVKIDNTVYDVIWQWEIVNYDDMGHTYSASSWHGYIIFVPFENWVHYPINFKIPLTKIIAIMPVIMIDETAEKEIPVVDKDLLVIQLTNAIATREWVSGQSANKINKEEWGRLKKIIDIEIQNIIMQLS